MTDKTHDSVHDWVAESGNAGVQSDVLYWESLEDDGHHVGASVSFGPRGVSISVGVEEDDVSCGALGNFSPEQAREIAATLEEMADLCEELQTDGETDAEPQDSDSLFRRLLGM